ncbi:hypothetical protein [Candidatus Palauibacter sp.]|uniref:hypothetical protein n=1 Tax=Candidatus Palauibacter sp. TaxID=3101350 RepID=UPI003B5AA615
MRDRRAGAGRTGEVGLCVVEEVTPEMLIRVLTGSFRPFAGVSRADLLAEWRANPPTFLAERFCDICDGPIPLRYRSDRTTCSDECNAKRIRRYGTERARRLKAAASLR